MNWSKIIEESGLSDVEIENETSIPRQVIYKIRNGETTNPQKSTIRKLVAGLKLKIGNPETKDVIERYIPIEEAETNHSPDKTQYKIMATVPAGQADMNEYNDWQETDDLWFDPREHFYLKINEEFGYSMLPLVSPGDLVLVSTRLVPQSGDIVAAKWDNDKGALKILSLNSTVPNMIALMSYNPIVPPLFVEKSKAALYKVVLIKKKK